MADSVANIVLKNEGMALHVGLDNTNSFYCETKRLANQAIKALSTFGFRPVMGKKTIIPSKVNGPISVFPVQIKGLQGNTLVILVKNDLLRAIGIEGIFRLPQLHHRGVKTIVLRDEQRRTGRRNHSVRK